MTQFRKVTGWTLSTGCDEDYRCIRDITWPNLAKYCARWRMNWRPSHWPKASFSDGFVPPRSFPSWNRLWNIRECLDRGSAYVVCVDADAVIVDQSQWIGDAVGDKSVYLGYQILEGEIFPSCGLMVVKNDETGNEWIDTLQRLQHRYLADPWCEQAVAYDLLGFDSRIKSPQGRPYVQVTEWTDRVGFLPRRWHSTPQDPVTNPVLFHATGGVDVGIDERVLQLREALRGN